MVRKYRGGEWVPGGTYLNSKAWELHLVEGEGEYLPAGESVTYYRAPLPLVLVLGPVVGLAFVIFLPLAVPAVAIYGIAKLIARRAPWRHGRTGRDLHATR